MLDNNKIRSSSEFEKTGGRRRTKMELVVLNNSKLVEGQFSQDETDQEFIDVHR